MADPLTLVHVYPDLLGTYGDVGNMQALVYRARARGIEVRVVDVGIDDHLPELGDLYLLGGGEDSAQALAARQLMADSHASVALGGGAPCFAVCAGLQLLAHSYAGADGRPQPGLGLLDVVCGRLDSRAVGEIVTEVVDLPEVGALSGFENHFGTALLGPGARPLGRVVAGVGNGDGDGRNEGALQDNIVATYLHGPALVRNPALADLLLSRAVGAELPPFDHDAASRLHHERIAAAVGPRLRRAGSGPRRRARPAAASRHRARRSGTP